MAQVVVQHEGADPEPIGNGRDGGHGRHRRQLRDEVVGNDERVDPDRFGALDRLPQLAQARDRARVGEEAKGAWHGVIVTASPKAVPFAADI